MKPFIAMINNAFNEKGQRGKLHNMAICRYCVVYEDKTLWKIPLINIYGIYDSSGQAKNALRELEKKLNDNQKDDDNYDCEFYDNFYEEYYEINK